MRLDVIVKETREFEIDDDVILTSDDHIVTLRSGCLCCTLRAEFVEALPRLHLRSSRIKGMVAVEGIGSALLPGMHRVLDSELRRRWGDGPRTGRIVVGRIP
jgi:G3E family GTPase